MLDIIHAAGWPIWLLVATSVITLAIIIERFLALRPSQVMPRGLPEQVLELMRRQQDEPDAVLRLGRNSPMGRILAEVAAQRQENDAMRQAAIEAVGRDVSWRLNRYLAGLATISVIAPLLGLFGTVVGMIEIFGAYDPAGGNPALLAHGIAIALYNTGFGILIAIPALIFHRYFRSRVEYFLHTMEREAGALDRLISRRAAS
ncbi:MotA/TolQ/ExbB proton channel family protein [uncultured Castellaniella sp.]|uniref:MotA/TolQ/ExbB proton channel family protein n=1 Tax=uncultured Castellaniella sp. TaxID=647907 RepID=UPI00262A6BDA|nr:MotA/TolQ/ExbB proton channel family protein [uncultured Castellaniella sp.]